MDATSGDTSDRFLQNLIVVLGVHAALIGTLWLISAHTKTPPPEQITWLDGGGFESPAAPSAPAPALPITPEPAPPPTPAPEPEPEAKEPPPDSRSTTPEPDDLAPPKPQPTPTPPPKATPTPAPKPKPTPKPAATPKPKVTQTTPKPKASPTPHNQVAKEKPKETQKLATTQKASPAPAQTTSKEGITGPGTSAGGNPGQPGGTKGGPGSPGGSATGRELQSYFTTVGNCYRELWDKPLTVIATGQDLSAIVRLRVNAKGEVLSVTMQRPTGNREVDASIEAAFPKFKKVPPPPPGLLQNGVLEENMAIIYEL